MNTDTTTPRRGARVWLDLARAGNFPSVWSNVLTALVLSAPVVGAWPSVEVLAIALVAGTLAYAGGATLNDVADVRFDAVHRPERAIPRGLVSRAAAARVAAVELGAALTVLVVAGANLWAAVGLGAVIVVYDAVHKHWGGAVVFMAGCRVLLALTLATLPGQVAGLALAAWLGALFIYIVGLSVLARWEYKPGAPAAKLGPMVGRLLAFIPLVDAVALAVIGAWWPALVCTAAVPLGRWAQRRAAST